MWVTDSQKAHLTAHGLGFSPTEDLGELAFREELARPGGRYKDSKGNPPAWDAYCDYNCRLSRKPARACL
jgi:hypothetical protein